ncbi:MAG TPA: ABC transporter permease [Terriglobia bacterium]|nr:ABC transporter permease [Terriglobia bacterium]
MNFTRFLRRTRWDKERSCELKSYLEIETEENIERGLPPEEAKYAAHRKLGSPTLIREEVYIMNSIGFFETLGQDLRFALRMLKRNPAFSALAVLSLALGIGSNAAMFSLVNEALIRPLPYPDPDRLVRITDYYPQGALTALQERSRTMDIAGYSNESDFNLTGKGEAMRIVGSSVSSNLFLVLQTGPELGRVLRPGENQPGRDRVVVLSHTFWQNKFGGSPAIIGRYITIDGVDRQVVGVMPTGFEFPSADVQLWVPLHLDPGDSFATWSTGFMPLVARLRPGFTQQQAQGQIRPLVAQILPLFPYVMFRSWNADATVLPLQRDLVANIRSRLVVLQSAVGLVLLIACANVAGLLLSRAAARQKEIAVRAALGAGRGRIIRQLLTESVVLAVLGAALGLALASFTFSDFKLLLPQTAPGVAAAQVDWRVSALMAIVATLAGLVFGLAPALNASKLDLASAIKTGGRSSGGTSNVRLRSALIAGEIALAALLAVSAGLLIKSLWLLVQVNPGFSTQQILTARITPNLDVCHDRAACVAFYNELLERAQGISGVSAVAAVNALPLTGETPALPVEVEGRPRVQSEEGSPMLWAGAVSPEYFGMMRIPILEGRGLTESDAETSAPVVVLSAATARMLWPGENPIGKHIRPDWTGREPWQTVVGIAADVRQYNLDNQAPSWLKGALYMPYPQAVSSNKQIPTAMTLLVRTGSDLATVANHLRELIRDLNPDVPVSEVRTMQQVATTSTSQPRTMMWLFVTFAAAALLLAAIGAYGVVSYTTSQRTFEIGMRMALGATRRSIFGLVLGQSFKLVLAGLAVGIAAALALTRMLSSFLYGIKATDPLTFVAVAGLLLTIALLAGYVPARRAASVDPLKALRVD